MIYAVNKRTKAHRTLGSVAMAENEWDLVQAIPDGWIEWQGGECPLPDAVPYEEKDRLGRVTKLYHPEMNEKHWEHRSGDDDTMAYRPIIDADTKPEPPAWDGEGLPPVGCECEINTRDGWVRATIVFSDGDIAIGRIHGGQNTSLKCDWSRKGFRPVRSEEDRAVEDMRNVMAKHAEVSCSMAETLATWLYRAGYRK